MNYWTEHLDTSNNHKKDILQIVCSGANTYVRCRTCLTISSTPCLHEVLLIGNHLRDLTAVVARENAVEDSFQEETYIHPSIFLNTFAQVD